MLSKINAFITKNRPPAKTAITSNPMKYPYTFTAKIAQFPWKLYYNTNWLFKYYMFGVLASMPVFIYLSKLSNSPENKRKWAEIRRKEAEERHYKP